MRRLLVPALLLPLLAAFAPVARAAGCEPEGDVCYPHDCLPWDPVGNVPGAVQAVQGADPVRAVSLLLPAPC
jgi:hypothetical protein